MKKDSQKRPCIVVVGGFLGAGKTTLIMAAAHLLERRGVRSAVILNDQGMELVDTRYAAGQGVPAREVTGGCFCCRFSDLMSEIEALREFSPDVIFAEPVGSCTDLSATVLGPLKEEFQRYRIAPLTVLVDPERAAALLRKDADPDLAFLFEKQLQEADVVCLTKADLFPGTPGIPGLETHAVSAVSGRGLEEWLHEVLSGALEPGKNTLNIDYTRYAEAEAALAWLNLSCVFEPASAISSAQVVGPFLDCVDEALTAAGIHIMHLKIFCNAETGWLKAAICANGEDPQVSGQLDASPSRRHELLVNLRAKGDPEVVRQIMTGQLRKLEGKKIDVRLDCFSPAPPKPERRVGTGRALDRAFKSLDPSGQSATA